MKRGLSKKSVEYTPHGGGGIVTAEDMSSSVQQPSGRQSRERLIRVKDGERQPSWHCGLCLLSDTTLHIGQVRGIGDHHANKAERPLGLWSRPQRDSGNKRRRTRSALVKVHTRTQGVRSRPVYGAKGLWLLTFLPSRGVDCKPHNPFSPTLTDKLTQAVPQGRGSAHNNNKQAEKQAG